MKLDLPVDTGARTFVGLGAETNTTLCRAVNGSAEIGEPYADLRDAHTLDAFEKELSGILSQADEVRLACDLHPQYVTTALAEKLSPSPHGPVRVQHHHAHIAAVLADRGLDGEVIGLAFDGTGYGPDGAIWGMEFLVASPAEYRRAAHLAYVPMPGGDRAVREPYRMAISHLDSAFGESLGGLREMYGKLFGEEKVAAVMGMMKSGINSPPTSSCGRLFNAVASILGICHVSGGKAEGPRGLEEMADRSERGSYGYAIREDGDARILDLSETIRSLTEEVLKGAEKYGISARFHNTVASAATDVAAAIAEEKGIRTVVLSGGVFMNALLRERLVDKLSALGIEAVIPLRVPPTDASLSLGQVYVAASRVE